MTVDETNSYLVTGDAEGVIKVWDISEYCAACTAADDSPPRESTLTLKFYFESVVHQTKVYFFV